MKKIFLVLATVLTVFVGLCSCSKEVSDVATENSMLLQDLVQINKELSKELFSSSKAEHGGGIIALADLGGAYAGGKAGAELGAELGTAVGNPITGGVFGAAIGALCVGAYSSWKEAQTEKEKPKLDEDDDDKNQQTKADNNDLDFDLLVSLCEKAISGETPSDVSPEIKEKLFVDEDILENTNLNSEFKNVGKMHNIVLAGLRGDISIETESNTKSWNKTKNSLESDILNSEEMKELLSSYEKESLSNSLSDSVLKLFNKIFEECARGSEDASIIINKYQQVIEGSEELSEEEKNNLSLAFGTALYSINFWKE